MERLTNWDEYGNADIIALSDVMPELYAGLSFSETNAMTDALNRLAAYEDTGLEPEEIISAVDMAKVACALEELNAYKELGPLDRLRELAEADREGRVYMKPKARKCPRCGSNSLVKRVDGACYYCFDCGAHIVPKEAEAALSKIAD